MLLPSYPLCAFLFLSYSHPRITCTPLLLPFLPDNDRYFQGKYSDLDAGCVSYGPCQTPTLGFCVMRHDEIENFQPEAFWAIDASFSPAGGGSKASAASKRDASRFGTPCTSVKFDWKRGRLFNQAAVSLYLQRIKDHPTGNRVLKVKVSTKKKPRPSPLNTVEMLKVASRNLGIGCVCARNCMVIRTSRLCCPVA